MSNFNPDFYSQKLILAPMVKAGRTPLRCLSLEYGADLAYTEEIIDQKLLACTRIQNGTIDYVIKDDIVLRIAMKEKEKCVLQIVSVIQQLLGSMCFRVLAHQNILYQLQNLCKLKLTFNFDDHQNYRKDDNMGCPKPFSLSGGMGAALLKKPDLVKEMLTSLVSASIVPVSCKIRVLDKLTDTFEFVDMAQKCGVSAIGVHGRRQNERPGNENRHSEIAEVARFVSVPVIASGESSSIKCYDDILKSREKCMTSSIMIAREALSRPSVFRPTGGVLNFDEEICNFLEKACIYDEPYTQTKYVVQRILGEFDPRGRASVDACTVREICKAWNKDEFYCRYNKQPTRVLTKRSWSSNENTNSEVEMAELSFPPKRLRTCRGGPTPKCAILKFCKDSNIEPPTYRVCKRDLDGKFDATITVNGRQFGSTVAQANKRMAEQVASLVALHGLNLRHMLNGEWE
ncbi:DRBM domain-containing protein [Aphelenchoides besseyi]|nr:DRBM domain-containing protein [Aphelenchoides besseyi]